MLYRKVSPLEPFLQITDAHSSIHASQVVKTDLGEVGRASVVFSRPSNGVNTETPELGGGRGVGVLEALYLFFSLTFGTMFILARHN